MAVPPRVGEAVAAADVVGADDVPAPGAGDCAQAAMTSPIAAKPMDRRLMCPPPWSGQSPVPAGVIVLSTSIAAKRKFEKGRAR